ncbi:hypothetical protein H6768_03585 [Candidatus Peribacteria bacterium]|nr:hypothetical protein [Candidatus Peribacteria bacterium]
MRDVFYLDQLQKWSDKGGLNYDIYCSRESSSLPVKHHEGRITEYLTQDHLATLNRSGSTEFYICGSPAMVTEVRSMLNMCGISPEKVLFEQY